MKKKTVIFVCDTRDYHAMDWFHQVKAISPDGNVFVATDISVYNKDSNLINADDHVVQLFNIGKLLLKNNSWIADIWRNFVKLFLSPIQIVGLVKLNRKYPDAIFHAHSMYYIFLCWLAKLKFIATPMGSDVLVRPDESRLYKLMTRKSLQTAHIITCDSEKMQDKVKNLCGRDSELIQNGIDVKMITSYIDYSVIRTGILSIRGLYPNYQIEKLLDAREQSNSNYPITFIYPFYEDGYRNSIKKRMLKEDKDVGRLPKDELYKLLREIMLVISIPDSDSSPRSVYESIFSGCCVAATNLHWIQTLPNCMRSRIFIVNFEEIDWFDKAIEMAKSITSKPYVPSNEALIEYDQYESMKRVCKELYNLI